MRRVEALAALTHDPGSALLREIQACTEPGPADVSRWRRAAPTEMVAAAMDLASGRRSLRGRRHDWAELWVDREGAAQASDEASAAWKAARLAGDQPLIDLCCGCGADLLALRRVVPAARGMDLREDRTWMASRNSGCTTITADVEAWTPDVPVAHLDPARRDESSGRRLHGWSDLTPGPAFVARMARELAGLAVKLGPGVDIPADERPGGSELAFLSRDGTLVQAVLLTGRAVRHPGFNTAVRLGEPMEVSGPPLWTASMGSRSWSTAPAWGRHIAEPDPSLERSGLLPQVARTLGLQERAAGLGLCTRDAPPEGHPAEAWFRWFERVDVLPARLPHVARRLRELGAGEVHVKVRGRAVDADAWSREVRGTGPNELVVLAHRTTDGAEAVIARRR